MLWHCWLGSRKSIRPIKNMGGWWRWALVSPDGVAPSRIVSVSASVNLPLHHKVQKFSSGTGSPGWSRKKGRKTVMVVVFPELLQSWILDTELLPCNGRFPGESGSESSSLDSPPLPPVLEENSGISAAGYLMGPMSPVTQQSMSKHWRKYKAWTPASGLDSSFLHPPPDSWWNGCWSHCASS